jgi:drug/metabolite transporter (DMT)-like permease
MTIFQIFVGVSILVLSFFRPLLYKPVAEKYSSRFSPFFISIWMVIGIILMYPFVQSRVKPLVEVVKSNPYSLLAGCLKGVAVWGAVWSSQFINRKSMSSSVFFPFISLSLAAVVLNLFFDENLKFIHLISIVLLGVLGGCFCAFGDARRMNFDEKRMFVIAVLFAGACSVLDHVGIKGLGWYWYLAVSNIVMVGLAIFRGLKEWNIKDVFLEKQVAMAGGFTICYEVLLIASMIAVLPVSFVSFFMRLSAPVVMVFSAIKFKEQTVKNQLIFGVLAILLALPMIFVPR